MKKTMLFILLLISYSINSQNFSENKIRKLNKLNINTNKYNLNDYSIQEKLNKILIIERKRKTNKTTAILLTSVATSAIILGGAAYSKDKFLGEILGGTLIAGGVFYAGVSIPFWSSSKKRKKERDKLIKMFEN